MVWKLGKFQSDYDELRFDVGTVLTVHKYFVFRLLIFKQHGGWPLKPKRCYWVILQWPCTKLHKGEQKDRTKSFAEFPNYISIDYGLTLTGIERKFIFYDYSSNSYKWVLLRNVFYRTHKWHHDHEECSNECIPPLLNIDSTSLFSPEIKIFTINCMIG